MLPATINAFNLAEFTISHFCTNFGHCYCHADIMSKLLPASGGIVIGKLI